jgi:hypothetical protein
LLGFSLSCSVRDVFGFCVQSLSQLSRRANNATTFALLRSNTRQLENIQSKIVRKNALSKAEKKVAKARLERVYRTQLRLARAQLKLQGTDYEYVTDYGDPAIEIVGGDSWLGRIARQMGEKFGVILVYDPRALFSEESWAGASYDFEDRVIYLPHSSILFPDHFNPDVLHEIRHASVSEPWRIHPLSVDATAEKDFKLPQAGKRRNAFEKFYDTYQSLDEVLTYYTEAVALKAQTYRFKSTRKIRLAAESRVDFKLARNDSLLAASRNEILIQSAFQRLKLEMEGKERTISIRRWRRDMISKEKRYVFLEAAIPIDFQDQAYIVSLRLPPQEIVSTKPLGKVASFFYTPEFLIQVRERLQLALRESRRIERLSKNLSLQKFN